MSHAYFLQQVLVLHDGLFLCLQPGLPLLQVYFLLLLLLPTLLPTHHWARVCMCACGGGEGGGDMCEYVCVCVRVKLSLPRSELRFKASLSPTYPPLQV